jgi:hypothetical protein
MIKKTFNYQLYRINWEDICSDSAWATDTEFDKMEVSHCISIGFLYKKTQKYIWIFASYEINDLGEITFGERTVIPANNIIKMEKING